jgi:hypothetical protein
VQRTMLAEEGARGVARAELAAVVEGALADWGRAHPQASLDEIVDAVDAELGRLRTRYIEDLAMGGAVVGAPPRCERCGGPLQQRGQRPREVLVPGQAAPVRVRRPYLVCPSCGTGVFPPG